MELQKLGNQLRGLRRILQQELERQRPEWFLEGFELQELGQWEEAEVMWAEV